MEVNPTNLLLNSNLSINSYIPCSKNKMNGLLRCGVGCKSSCCVWKVAGSNHSSVVSLAKNFTLLCLLVVVKEPYFCRCATGHI